MALIGTLAAIAAIIFLSIICICLSKTKSTGGVNLTVTNPANSSSESPLCISPAIAPSCPSAYEMLAMAPAEGLPPPYHSTVDIDRLIAIPKPDRTASEIQAVIAHFEGKNNSPHQV